MTKVAATITALFEAIGNLYLARYKLRVDTERQQPEAKVLREPARGFDKLTLGS